MTVDTLMLVGGASLPGFLILVLALSLVALGRGDWKRRRRIASTPSLPIDRAPGDGPVQIRGRAAPGAKGTVHGTYSARPALWMRSFARVPAARSGFKTTNATVAGEELVVDDGTGQVARVLLERALVLVDGAAEVQVDRKFMQPGLSYWETLLVAGATVHVIGPSRRADGQLVLHAGEGPDGELIVTTRADVARRFGRRYLLGLAVACLGAVLMVAGWVLVSVGVR